MCDKEQRALVPQPLVTEGVSPSRLQLSLPLDRRERGQRGKEKLNWSPSRSFSSLVFAFRGFPAFPVGGRSLDAAEVARAQQLPVAIALPVTVARAVAAALNAARWP